MLSSERRRAVAQLVQETGRGTVLELSSLLGVSQATIRRDLAMLAESGMIERVFGGAVTVTPETPQRPVTQRAQQHTEEKKRIGRAAAALVAEGETIFLGSGSTTLEVAKNLAGRNGLTVITNALNVADVLSHNSDIEMIFLGGLLRHSELSIIGHITELCLKELRADKVIMGINAVSAQHGLTNDYLPETLTDRAIMALCEHIILVADHSKLGKVSTCFVAPLSAAHTLVTDSGISPEQLTRFRAAGLEVIAA